MSDERSQPDPRETPQPPEAGEASARPDPPTPEEIVEQAEPTDATAGPGVEPTSPEAEAVLGDVPSDAADAGPVSGAPDDAEGLPPAEDRPAESATEHAIERELPAPESPEDPPPTAMVVEEATPAGAVSNGEDDSLSPAELAEERSAASAADDESGGEPDAESGETPAGDSEVEPPRSAPRPPDGPLELLVDEIEEEEVEKDWYILKVASNRENSVADALRRKVSREGLEKYVDEVIVPTEDVAEYKNGKRKVSKRKLYPGYIVVHMAINDETWFLVRETFGIGDFTGSGGKPTPMLPHEVERILPKEVAPGEEEVRPAIPFKEGDRVRIKEGTFQSYEGEVAAINEAKGDVTVNITIFNRTAPTDVKHWQLEEA